MNSTHLSPTAKTIVNDLEREAAERFDATLLHNLMADTVGEDDQLLALANAVAEAQHARDVRDREFDGDDYSVIRDCCESAEDQLHETLGHRVVEIIAEQCRVVLDDGDEWRERGHVEQDDLGPAQIEAARWLNQHDDLAERLFGEPPSKQAATYRGP